MITDREREVLTLIRRDPMVSQQALASRLGISRSAVAGHIMHLTRKGLIKLRYHFFKIFEYGLLVIPEALGILAAHASGRPPEFRFLSRRADRFKQVHVRTKSIDVVEIGIDEDKFAISAANLGYLFIVKGTDFGSQHVAARVARNMDRNPFRHPGVLTPQGRIVFPPCKKMRYKPD